MRNKPDVALITKAADIERLQLWHFMPVLEVPFSDCIPGDWPGLMGVPITFMDKLDRNQFELLDCIKPRIGTKNVYPRLIIRNLHPALPEEVDIADYIDWDKWNLKIEECACPGRKGTKASLVRRQ